MNKKIKAVIYGVGAMGKTTARQMAEKGVELIGAIGHINHIGSDLGDVIGLDRALDVKISNDADDVLAKAAARQSDIVVMTVGSLMDQMMPHFTKCLKYGLNVITIAEESFYPWRAFPKQAKQLDQIAKAHHVSLVSVGMQDVFWHGLLSVLSGASHTIELVLGQNINNIDEFGPITSKNNSVGETPEAYYQKFQGQQAGPSCFGLALEAIVAGFGFKIAERKEWIEPVTAASDVMSRSFGVVVAKGLMIGRRKITEIVTEKEAIKFRAELTAKIFESNEETETSSWYIKGIPDLHLVNNNLNGAVATCAAVVNRIPDVINCEPGLVTVDRLPRPQFRSLY
jgi:4-hydroxy-tetrahydrodipicolinate reductase